MNSIISDLILFQAVKNQKRHTQILGLTLEQRELTAIGEKLWLPYQRVLMKQDQAIGVAIVITGHPVKLVIPPQLRKPILNTLQKKKVKRPQ